MHRAQPEKRDGAGPAGRDVGTAGSTGHATGEGTARERDRAEEREEDEKWREQSERRTATGARQPADVQKRAICEQNCLVI